MTHNIYLYILVMAGTTFLIRTLPVLLIKKPIENRFVKSFLYYVPYVTLAVMTVPAIIEAASTPWIGLVTLVAGCILAWIGLHMVTVAIACSAMVLILGLLF